MTKEEKIEAGYGGKPKLSKQQAAELCKDFIGGINQKKLKEKYSLSYATVRNYLLKAGLVQPRRVKRPSAKDGPAPDLSQPTIENSKHYRTHPQLATPNQIPAPVDPLVTTGIVNENQKLSLKNNLLWAIQSAGLKLRTGEEPRSCPNDQAYFLFMQALDAPKDFMTKFTQVLNKVVDYSDEKELNRQTKMALMDIDEQLKTLEGDDEEPDDFTTNKDPSSIGQQEGD